MDTVFGEPWIVRHAVYYTDPIHQLTAGNCRSFHGLAYRQPLLQEGGSEGTTPPH